MIEHEEESEPVVLHSKDVKPVTAPGGAVLRRIITPKEGCSKVFYVGVVVADPGQPTHRWHTHTYDKVGDYEVKFPEGFEEAYYIFEGSGTLYWRVKGRVKQRKVKRGDGLFFPAGVVKHQLVNTGKKPLKAVYVGAPPLPFMLNKD